jgi:hypothetical protein
VKGSEDVALAAFPLLTLSVVVLSDPLQEGLLQQLLLRLSGLLHLQPDVWRPPPCPEQQLALRSGSCSDGRWLGWLPGTSTCRRRRHQLRSHHQKEPSTVVPVLLVLLYSTVMVLQRQRLVQPNRTVMRARSGEIQWHKRWRTSGE